MLEFGSKTITIDGITVFADHADPNQFWYLPGPVQIARRPKDNRAAFSFIKYGDIQDDKVIGKGFLMVELNLRLDKTTERRIMSKLSSIAPDRPKLAAVSFDEGTVECIALDLQGGGGTAQVSDKGTFNAVENILGATVPSLHGDNAAAFSITLSKEGAVILQSVFEGGGSPIGAIYNLTYTGLRPALEVVITANFKRIYDHFSANLEGQVYMVRAGIEAGFEELVDRGIIQIKVINFSTAENRMQQENWALNFFKDKLLQDWFKPTLTPGELAGGMAAAENLDKVRARAEKLKPKETPTPAPPREPAETPAGTPNDSNTNTRPRSQIVRQGTPEAPRTQEPLPEAEDQSIVERILSGIANRLSAVPKPPQATGVNAQETNLPSSNNISLDSAVVSFKLKYVKQIEDKQVTLRLNRSEAVQRTYAPQGFFGLLAQDLSKEGHFFEVDGDDSFFREFKLSVESPFDRERIGLASAHVQLDYGGQDNGSPKHKDFVIDKNTAEKLDWKVKMIPGITNYNYQVQYHFDPDSPWEGEKLSYNLPAITTEDRTLMVHPFDRLGFLEIEVSPSLIDWTLVSDVEVQLLYEDSGGWRNRETIHFTSSSTGAKYWKLRLNNREEGTYSYVIHYQLKDGNKSTIEVSNITATKIAVPNPFFKIDVEFIPLFMPGDVRLIFIDVEYEDIENDFRIQKRVRLNGTDIDSVKVQLNIVNGLKRTFSYRYTIIGNDNKMTRRAFVETTETLIGVDLMAGSS